MSEVSNQRGGREFPAAFPLDSRWDVIGVPLDGQLPQCAVGEMRYVASSNGMFIEGCSHVLHACVQLSNDPMVWGPLQPFVSLPCGAVPQLVMREVMMHAMAATPNSVALVVFWNPRSHRYEVAPAPREHESSNLVPLDALFWVHAAGNADAHSSAPTMDIRRAGPHFEIALGHCGEFLSMQVAARLRCGTGIMDLTLDDLRRMRVIE